jgi:uncharacterized membrane protein
MQNKFIDTNQNTVVIKEAPLQSKQRIQSIDILRGTVMLIMALDHVRDFFHITAFSDDPTNLATTTPALFFTRWITHFCAPVFVFLSGTSAYLVGQKKSKKELSGFLIKRGIWLIFVEVAIITLGWTFNPLYNLIILQVIWAIGWSMIILGLLVRTSPGVIVVIGCIILFGHNIFDYLNLPKEGTASALLNVLFTSPFKFYSLNSNHMVADVYAILPWTGAMLIGYGFGYFYRSTVSVQQRRKMLLFSGIGLTALFLILRFINQYGDPAPWSQQKAILYSFLSFLKTTKYPCSLQYLCMTLGPAMILLALIEHARNKLTAILTIYGRVPFFFYVCHIYLVHFICVTVFFASGYSWNQRADPNTPFLFRPLHFGFDLWVVYAIWLFIIIVLYWPCKWFNKYKSAHHQWWLSYV